MTRSTICQFACTVAGIALLLIATTASARVNPNACGGARISCHADCAILEGDECDPLCKAFFMPECLDQACEHTPQGLVCSVMDTEFCDLILTHECDHLCRMDSITKLFCDGALISSPETCLPELCSKGFDIENYTCGPR